MTKFGGLIKKTIKLSGLKYAVIADRLNFDASYISKWVTSDTLPSSRIIESICKDYSAILVEDTAIKDRPRLFSVFDIVYTQESKEDTLKKEIYTALLDAYKEDDINRSICRQKTTLTEKCNISSEKRNTIFKELTQYRLESTSLHIYIIGDLYQFAIDDIVFFMDLEYHVLQLKFEIASINFYLTNSLPASVNIKTNIALMNLLMIGSTLKAAFYTIHAQCCGLIIGIEDVLLYNSQLLMNNNWKLGYINYDKKMVAEFIDYIIKDLSPLNQQIFETYDLSDSVSNKAKNNIFYIKEFIALNNTFNCLLISTDILERIFTEDENIPDGIKKGCITKQHMHEKRIENGDLVKILLFRNAYEQLIYDGIINIMGYTVTVPLEVRMIILDNLKTLLTSYPNLQLKIIDRYLIDEIKHTYLPNFTLSKTEGMFLSTSSYNPTPVNVIRNKLLHTILSCSFDYIWDERLVSLYPAKLITEEYIALCNEMIFFDLL